MCITFRIMHFYSYLSYMLFSFFKLRYRRNSLNIEETVEKAVCILCFNAAFHQNVDTIVDLVRCLQFIHLLSLHV
jgi:hypothetical protein